MPSPENPLTVVSSLGQAQTYLAEFRRVIERNAGFGRKPREQWGLELRDFDVKLQQQLAAELARAVPRGEYQLGAVEARAAFVGGKARTLYRASITDTLVLGALARVLGALLEPELSSRLFSYRSGRSALGAARDFSAYLREHRSQQADPRRRGLYVLRRDVARYGESIPVTPGAPLYAALDSVLERAGTPPFMRALLQTALRPEVVLANGEVTRLDRGVPTGSPIQPAICNLYLSPLDRALEAISGGIYARFGDDLLFAHPDPEVAAQAAMSITAELSRLGLELKAEKSVDWFFNGAGRSAGAVRGTQFIEYLGLRVAFAGQIGLTRNKARRVQQQLSRRLENTIRLSAPQATEPGIQILGRVASRAFDLRLPLSEPLLGLIRHAIDDRAQLQHLDYLFARQTAELLTRQRGVRAFRSCPYRALREAGLPSLLTLKNRARRP